MRDPISSPIDLAFLVICLFVMALTAFMPHKAFAILNTYSHAEAPSESVFTAVRIIAGLCTVGVAVLLLVHFFRAH